MRIFAGLYRNLAEILSYHMAGNMQETYSKGVSRSLRGIAYGRSNLRKGIWIMKFEGFSTENKHLAKLMTTTADTLITDIFQSCKERCSVLGLGLSAGDTMPVYFAALCGSPGESRLTDYKNSLFRLREDLIASPKFLMFIMNELHPPTPGEMSFFDAVSRGNPDETVNDFVALININGDVVRTKEAKRIFSEMAEDLKAAGDEALFSYGVRMITWLNRCTVSADYARCCAADIPVLIYYGRTGAEEISFMHFLSRIGCDVIYISTEKASLPLLKSGNIGGRMQIFEFPDEKAQFPYPDRLMKAAVATTAYSAERELDRFMYSNTSIFKDFQFSDMQALTLKTTYEEIEILWHQAAKYRAGFDVIENRRAVVPNIFAKISGVKDGDIDRYWDDVREKLSPFTRIINKAPSYNKYSNAIFTAYREYYSGSALNIAKIKDSSINPYGFLSDYLQTLIFTKMQEAVDSGWLKLEQNELVPLVLYVGLNLDREILRILQKFDFTKDIPKIIVIDVIEDTFSKIECIQLVLFNLLGFDILVYTPTGYRNLETYISENAYETHTMNEFIYNAHVPRLKIPSSVPEPKNSGGFLNKLFKKGRS